MKTATDHDVYTPKLLLKAVNTLIEARPVGQLEYATGTLYEFYSVQSLLNTSTSRYQSYSRTNNTKASI